MTLLVAPTTYTLDVAAKTDTTSRTGSRQNENSAAQAPRDRHAVRHHAQTYPWRVPGNAQFAFDDGTGATALRCRANAVPTGATHTRRNRILVCQNRRDLC